MKTRINKYLSEVGVCSRREAERLIKAERVILNNTYAQLGSLVDENDTILIDGKPIQKVVSYVYIAYHKPVGIISTANKTIKNNIVDAINYKERIFHVGRLDKDSEGLIFMTNHGEIVDQILSKNKAHEKEYLVQVDRAIDDKTLELLSQGVNILGKKTKPCKVTRVHDDTFKIILTEGMNRQIRRMTKVFNYKVIKLKRIRIMHVSLDIPVGTWRYFNKEEVTQLMQAINP